MRQENDRIVEVVAEAKAKSSSTWRGVSGLTSNLPRFGLSFPARTLSAVDFPIPFVPTRPRTCPGLGMGSLHVFC